MRPYLAIIKDSFREALASRVLWILLILVTLGLAALAPLGFRAEQTTDFRQGDFVNARGFVGAMLRQYDAEVPSPGLRICGSLDQSTRDLLNSFASDEKESRSSFYTDLDKIIDALNELLKKPDLYQQDDWSNVLLGSEARELLDKGPQKLSENEQARLNRLLIEVPFQEYFRPQPPTQMIITYFGAGISPPIRLGEHRVKQIIEQIVLPSLIGFLVGFIAVLAAIVVTSPIIPQMFDPGSLSLLLSKPISRSLMFLAKFVGGCAVYPDQCHLLDIWVVGDRRLAVRHLEPSPVALHSDLPVSVCGLLQRVGRGGGRLAQCHCLCRAYCPLLVRLLGGRCGQADLRTTGSGITANCANCQRRRHADRVGRAGCH